METGLGQPAPVAGRVDVRWPVRDRPSAWNAECHTYKTRQTWQVEIDTRQKTNSGRETGNPRV